MRRKRQLVDWSRVREFSFTYCEPLLSRHGLVDGMTMAHALDQVVHEASDALEAQGLQSLADWLVRELEHAAKQIVPESVSRVIWERASWGWDRGPQRWAVLWYPFHLANLDYLDRRMGLAPHLWVLPDWVRLASPLQDRLGRSQFARVFYHHPLLELPTDEPETWEDGWIVGLEPDNNRWWKAHTVAAAERLAKFSARGLEALVRENREVRAGGPEASHFWEVVYRPRIVQLPHAGNQDVEERDPTVSMPLPELGALPFYHIDQLERLHSACVNGQVAIPLLGDLCDADFKAGIIAEMRVTRGYPREETRGRHKRDPALAEKASKLVRHEGLSKRRAAKELGIPRASLYNMLRGETDERGRGG